MSRAWKESISRQVQHLNIPSSKSQLRKCKTRFSFISKDGKQAQSDFSIGQKNDSCNNEINILEQTQNQREQISLLDLEESIESCRSSQSMQEKESNQFFSSDSFIIAQTPSNMKNYLVKKFLQKIKQNQQFKEQIVRDQYQPQKGDMQVIRQQKFYQTSSQNISFIESPFVKIDAGKQLELDQSIYQDKIINQEG